MATITRRGKRTGNDYPTSDGRPMAETDLHRELMFDLIKTLQAYYAADSMVYVSGNLLVFYVPGDRLRHLSPDVFVVKGVPKRERPNYLTWEEGKGPGVVIELTSSSTRDEDVQDKFQLYQNNLRVPEYFLFDPLGDYLDPPLRGYRLREGKYAPIRPFRGRLPSKVLGLHLERHGRSLRLYDPAAKQWLLTPEETIRQMADTVQRVGSENEQLRRELEALRRRLGEKR
ncbi:MAG TPA: Uma2 family endonuclease [Gemmataceae bacterium]|nr:Uma2 family endonuclease [Gemmataceae bacterium]